MEYPGYDKPNQTILDDKKWQEIKKQFLGIDDSVTAVGFFPEDTYANGKYIAYIMSIHEYGTRNGRIPERSFMRAWADSNKMRINQKKLQLIGMMIDGVISFEKALRDLGDWSQEEIRKFITRLSVPPNAPATIKAKGFDNPLIWDSTAVNSVRHKEYYHGVRPQ